VQVAKDLTNVVKLEQRDWILWDEKGIWPSTVFC